MNPENPATPKIAALVPIRENAMGGNAVSPVDARGLHGFLRVETPFHFWVHRRITDYNFSEGSDFLDMNNSVQNPQGGRPIQECFLTLDMVKKFAMVERNQRSREARKQHPALWFPNSNSEISEKSREVDGTMVGGHGRSGRPPPPSSMGM